MTTSLTKVKSASDTRGAAHGPATPHALLDSMVNRGVAFTDAQRDALGLTGRLPAETLQAIRAVEVLEQIGSKEARATLAKLAGGAADARLTREARGALERLNRP